jgi:serine/threonine-protein kinase
MIARRRLFKSEAEGETLNRLLYEPIPSLRSVDPEVPRELDEICAKALTRDLDKRFATAAEFSDALEEAARELDWLGSHREVATCVADVLGRDLSERRADLRAWIADTERRSLAPPAESSGDSGAPPKGAMVSVYVPPLFDMGTLRGAAEGSQSPSRERRGVKGLALVAVIALAGSAGLFRWWHRPSQAAAAPQGASLPASPADEKSVASAMTAIAATTATVTAAPDPLPASSAPASAATPPSRPPVMAVARPVHPSSAAARPTESAAPPKPAVSVPQDMLYNPYRDGTRAN